MQNCLGIYIENNLIKYAKVSKEKSDYKIEAFGISFFDDLNKGIKKIIEETYSFNTPISINLTSETYMYYDIFSLLSKNDIQKSIETEFETYCDENKYNAKAFETRYALVPNIEEQDKIKAIQVAVNKIELNKQKQYLDKSRLTRITPIGVSIASIQKFDKKENALIINMEDKTTITTIYDNQIYNVETLEVGSEEILAKINRTENSMSKAYEICKTTTIYTSNVIEETQEQPYLEEIVPVLYQICERMKEIVDSSPVKISNVYLTGTLAVVNNVDLYFQEFLTNAECKILKPNILEATSSQINIKDYIEVNSAISLAMTALGEGIQSLNFKTESALEKLKGFAKIELPSGKSNKAPKEKKESKFNIDFSFKGVLSTTEKILLRCAAAILILNIAFMIFSKLLYSQMEKKEEEVQSLITDEISEINKINSDKRDLDEIKDEYDEQREEIERNNDKISTIAKMKDTIPNLLNQVMWVIPEQVQLISIQDISNGSTGDTDTDNSTRRTNTKVETNSDVRKIKIEARSKDYDQIGYFFSKIKLENILKNATSSSSQKSGGYVSVTIEGEVP